MILTVRQLTEQIRNAIEGGFPYVWVRGEVTNLSRPSSGHIYFSLKDESAQLQSVWFKGSHKEREAFDPLTGEVFEDGPRLSLATTLRNGQQVICAGRLTVYAPRGGYQLLVDFAQDSGEGQLHLALEALRRKLEEKGYFRLERKRTLPEHPFRVSVITASSGAALQDFLRIANGRGTGAELRIHPVPVQGDEAPPRIAEAIRTENAAAWAEVLVLIRGGGSLQDLWAFNDERVAEAIFTSPIPVLAGIGHEVDTSLADMVADVRAATPTHAAQLLWPERQWYAQRIDDMELQLSAVMNRRSDEQEKHLRDLVRALTWLSPLRGLARMEERFQNLQQRLEIALARRLQQTETRLEHLNAAVLRSLRTQNLDAQLEQVNALEQRLHQLCQSSVSRQAQKIAFSINRLAETFPRHLERLEHRYEQAHLKLGALNPERPLERGYAFALTPDGHFIRSVGDLKPGGALTVKLRDGEVDARVTAVRSTGE